MHQHGVAIGVCCRDRRHADGAASVLKAIEKQDMKTIVTVWQAVRGLALAVVHESEYNIVNIAAIGLEADLDNDLWGHAPRSVESFFRSLRAATVRTYMRN